MALRSIGICLLTYRRPQLLRATLESLGRQTVLAEEGESAAAERVRVYVVDNDKTRSGEPVVAVFKPARSLEIVYLANPHNGLATARNLAMRYSTDDFVAFLDDDATVAPDWLENLLRTADYYAADVVTGPAAPRCIGPSDWILDKRLVGSERRETGSRVRFADGNNTLVRANIVNKFSFDPTWDATGGEDTDFFLRVGAAERSMIWCEEARVVEAIPSQGSKIFWLLRRAFKGANRITSICIRHEPGVGRRTRFALAAFGGAVLGALSLPLGAVSRQRAAGGLWRIGSSFGTLSAVLGYASVVYREPGHSSHRLNDRLAPVRRA